MSSSRSLALLVLAGCNQLLGIKDTDPAPPVYYDGGIDAARGCPAPGAQPDSYSPYVHQAYEQDCQYVTAVPAGRAIALCYSTGGATIYEGAWGQPLVPAALTPNASFYGIPRLSPDGQRVLLPVEPAPSMYTVFMFLRQSDGTWQQSADAGFGGFTGLVNLSTIGHAPTGDRVLVGDISVSEWEFDGAQWHVVQQHPELDRNDHRSLTSDALHLMVSSALAVTYTDRLDASGPFRTPVSLAGVPNLDDLFMTDDCSRVYMSGFGALYYVQQD